MGNEITRYNHRHNSLLGHASCFGAHLQAILRAPSASVEAKATAQRILDLQQELLHKLRTVRVNADGTLSIFPQEPQQ